MRIASSLRSFVLAIAVVVSTRPRPSDAYLHPVRTPPCSIGRVDGLRSAAECRFRRRPHSTALLVGRSPARRPPRVPPDLLRRGDCVVSSPATTVLWAASSGDDDDERLRPPPSVSSQLSSSLSPPNTDEKEDAVARGYRSGEPMLRTMTRTLYLMNEEMKASGEGFSDTQLAIILDFLETYYIPKIKLSRRRKTSLGWAFRISEASKLLMASATVLISGLLQRGAGGSVPLDADGSISGGASFLDEYGLLSLTLLGGLQTLVVSFGTLFQPRERAMLHLAASSEMELAWNAFIWGARTPGNIFQDASDRRYNFWGGNNDPEQRHTPWVAFQAFASAVITAASMGKKAQMEALDKDEES